MVVRIQQISDYMLLCRSETNAAAGAAWHAIEYWRFGISLRKSWAICEKKMLIEKSEIFYFYSFPINQSSRCSMFI